MRHYPEILAARVSGLLTKYNGLISDYKTVEDHRAAENVIGRFEMPFLSSRTYSYRAMQDAKEQLEFANQSLIRSKNSLAGICVSPAYIDAMQAYVRARVPVIAVIDPFNSLDAELTCEQIFAQANQAWQAGASEIEFVINKPHNIEADPAWQVAQNIASEAPVRLRVRLYDLEDYISLGAFLESALKINPKFIKLDLSAGFEPGEITSSDMQMHRLKTITACADYVSGSRYFKYTGRASLHADKSPEETIKTPGVAFVVDDTIFADLRPCIMAVQEYLEQETGYLPDFRIESGHATIAKAAYVLMHSQKI